MPSTSAAPATTPLESTYPPIDEATAKAINLLLVDVVSLAHGGKLSSVQLREFTTSLEAQSCAIETLHRFKLLNSDEPAFTVTAMPGQGS